MLKKFKTKIWSLLEPKDFESRLKNAAALMRHVQDSTIGGPRHMYNTKGEQIRGWYSTPAKMPKAIDIHPLIAKYETWK